MCVWGGVWVCACLCLWAQKRTITELDSAIEEKDRPLQLTTTRLETRERRPNVELVKDSVEHSLLCE